MRPGAENCQNKLPGVAFGYMCGHWLKIVKMSFLGHMCGQGLKIDKMNFQGYFWPYLRPGVENVQNELPGATFGCVCGQGLKMFEISFMGLLLAICAAIC